MKKRKTSAFSKGALERAVNFVREARAERISKGAKVVSRNSASKTKVNGSYPTYLKNMGIDSKEGWNQMGMTDHDIAVALLRLGRICQTKKVSEVDFTQFNGTQISPVEVPKAVKTPNTTKVKKVPAHSAKNTLKEARETPVKNGKVAPAAKSNIKRLTIRIFGKEIFSREVAQ